MEILQLKFIYFVAGAVAAFYLIPSKWRWNFIALISLVFVGITSLEALLILLACVFSNTFFSRQILSANTESKKAWLLASSLFSNLSLLGVFKYYNFFNRAQNWLIEITGLEALFPVFTLLLPLGISYYVFQAISMNMDAYFGKLKSNPSFEETTLFLAYFPKISAGPIERFSSFIAQTKSPSFLSYQNIQAGGRLILWGFFKKIFVSSRIQSAIDPLFKADNISVIEQWIGTFFYAVQVYVDVSGYTDIAIGISMLFGLKLSENFNRPFIANSVSDFWRRWHISLSSWVADYVFKPINLWLALHLNFGKSGTYLALILSFAIMGIWHGASTTFLVFGIIQGVFLSVEAISSNWRKKRLSNFSPRSLNLAGIIYAQIIFYCSCLLFKANTLNEGRDWIQRLFSFDLSSTAYFSVLTANQALVLTFAALFIFVDQRWITPSFHHALSKLNLGLRWFIYAILIYATIALSSTQIETFIYNEF